MQTKKNHKSNFSLELIGFFVAVILVSGCADGFAIASFDFSDSEKSCDELISDMHRGIIDAVENGELVTAKRVIDGDTLVLEDDIKIRLIGIDTKERGEFSYKEAGESLAELTLGKQLYLTKDITAKDKYGRSLNYIFTEDTFVNAEQVRRGWAKSYRYEPDTYHSDLFDCLETEAKQKGISVWI